MVGADHIKHARAHPTPQALLGDGHRVRAGSFAPCLLGVDIFPAPLGSDVAASLRRLRYPYGLAGSVFHRQLKYVGHAPALPVSRAILSKRSVHFTAGRGGSHFWVRRPIARAHEVSIIAQYIFIFRMDGDPAATMAQHITHALIISDKQIAGRRPHEYFHPANPGHIL